jgi:hypothetical protein
MASAENEIIIVMCGLLDVMEKIYTHTHTHGVAEGVGCVHTLL